MYAATPPRFTSWRERATEFGAVVELEAVIGQDGEELRFRQLHLFETDGDRVTAHTLYCTGPWDAETIARHRAEAPIVAGRAR